MKQQNNMLSEKFMADALIFDKLDDLSLQAERRGVPRFTHFLDERQQVLAERHLRTKGMANGIFFGGHDEAQRKMLGFFPPDFALDFVQEMSSAFPIVPITFTYHCFSPKDCPTHRDFLGALMGLGIKRELVGDILVEEGLAVAFLDEVGARVAQDSIDKIGRVRVKLAIGAPEKLPKAFTLQPILGTVGSLRLDGVVAFLLNLSREKASGLVKSGSVRVNFFEESQVTSAVKEGDILSIDGEGRFVISKIGGETKKGRIHIIGGKYI